MTNEKKNTVKNEFDRCHEKKDHHTVDCYLGKQPCSEEVSEKVRMPNEELELFASPDSLCGMTIKESREVAKELLAFRNGTHDDLGKDAYHATCLERIEELEFELAERGAQND